MTEMLGLSDKNTEAANIKCFYEQVLTLGTTKNTVSLCKERTAIKKNQIGISGI